MQILESKFTGISIRNISKTSINNIKIPLPPIDIQKQIVAECESVDDEILNLNKQTSEFKEQSSKIFDKFNVKFDENSHSYISKFKLEKLGKLTIIQGGNGFSKKYQGILQKTDINTAFLKVSDMNLEQNSKYITIANNYVENKILTESIKAKIFPINTIIFPKVGKAIDTNKKKIIKNSCFNR